VPTEPPVLRSLPLPLKVALRLVLCVAVTWLVHRYLGLLGAVATIPLYAAALASPLYEFFTGTWRATKAHVLRDVQGRYFQHRGFAIDVVEDDDDRPWLLVRDVRKALPSLPRDEVLQRLVPGRARAWSPGEGLRIRADAMVDVLRNAQEPAGLKFKAWVDREVLRGSAGTRD
jgi:hypothetical protein